MTIPVSKHGKLAALFTQEDINAIKNLIQKGLENAEAVSTVEYSTPNVPDSSSANPYKVKPETLSLEQQKAIVQFSSKDKLWQILENDNAWYDFLQKSVPTEYLKNFFQRMEELAIKDPKIVAEMATMFVKNKVSLEHLQLGVASVWNPESLEEGSEYLYINNFVENPTVKINLQAKVTKSATTARKLRLA